MNANGVVLNDGTHLEDLIDRENRTLSAATPIKRSSSSSRRGSSPRHG